MGCDRELCGSCAPGNICKKCRAVRLCTKCQRFRHKRHMGKPCDSCGIPLCDDCQEVPEGECTVMCDRCYDQEFYTCDKCGKNERTVFMAYEGKDGGGLCHDCF